MAESALGFAGVVGWHMSQISLRLQLLAQTGLPDFVGDDEVGRPEAINKILKLGDATEIDGGGLLFHGESESVEHWLIVDVSGRSLPILNARIDSVISSSPYFEQFVHDVYYKILGRKADDAGLDLYVSLLSAGTLTRSAFVEVIASSYEAREKNRPLLIVAYPYSSFDKAPEAASEEKLISALSITVADI